jgi:hypothetical protein
MEPAPLNDASHESLELRFGRRQSIVEGRYLLVKHTLRLVTVFRERIKRVREPIIKPRQNLNSLGGSAPVKLTVPFRHPRFFRAGLRGHQFDEKARVGVNPHLRDSRMIRERLSFALGTATNAQDYNLAASEKNALVQAG